MKVRILVPIMLATLVAMASFTPQSFADPGTTFTYQGQLADGGVPIDSAVDLRFTLYDADTGGTVLGSPITLNNVSYADGVVQEDLDFGAQFDGSPRWLEVELANSTGGSFTTLTPRVELKPVPYAMYAQTAQTALDDADTDASNELQTLSFTSPTLTISNGNSVDLSSLVPSGADGYSLDADDGDPVDAVYVDSEGNVGVGTTSPKYSFNVGGTGGIGIASWVATNTPGTSLSGTPNSYVATTGGTTAAQSFTYSTTRLITRLKVMIDSQNTQPEASCNIYEGEGIDGTLLTSASCTLPTGTTSYATIDFDEPVILTGGNKYTFELVSSSSTDIYIGLISGNYYSSGRWIEDSNYDMVFSTYDGEKAYIAFPDGTTQKTAYDSKNKYSLDAADGDPTDAVYVKNNGYVGIGTTGPTYPLTINNNGKTEASYSGATSGQDARVQMFVNTTNITGGGIAVSNEGGWFDLNDGYVTYLPLDDGLGVRVMGALKVVTNAWPDYVFDEDYPLASLHDVEKSIQENGHLPNVPSAKEIERDGVSVGEMNGVLLRQIEELTLRQIEMNKTIESLRQEVETLKADRNEENAK